MPLLSIIIPAFNEGPTIEAVIKRVESCSLPEGFDREIIVINDGSTDQTRDILRQFEGSHVVIHSINTGKGGAVRKGFNLARGEFIVVQDADLEQNPEDFCSLLMPIVQKRADVVFGSRFLGPYKPPSMLMSAHYQINRLFSLLTNLLTRHRTTDVWTGYKMYSREALHAIMPYLTSDSIEFELEIAMLLHKKKLRVCDVPISYVPRWYQDGKKTNWKQAIRSLWKLVVFKTRHLK